MPPDLPEFIEGIPTWVWAVAVVAISLIVSIGIRLLAGGRAPRPGGSNTASRQLARFGSLTVLVLGVLYAFNLAGVEVGPLLGAVGLGGVAVAFAAQDLLQNLFAGIVIQIRRPFRVGDQIDALDHEGTVLDVDFRAVRLLTHDGLDVVLPNAEVLRNPIINHTRTPQRRTMLEVGVRYDTDLDLAQTVMIDAVAKASGVRVSPQPQAWVREFADSAIVICVLFWHGATMADLWPARSAAAIAIKKALDANDIEIPFPQRVLWQGVSAERPSDDNDPG